MTAKATHSPAKPAHKPVHRAAKKNGKPETETRFLADLKHIFDQAVKAAMTAPDGGPSGNSLEASKREVAVNAIGWISDYLGTDANPDLPASGLDGIGGDDDDAIEDLLD